MAKLTCEPGQPLTLLSRMRLGGMLQGQEEWLAERTVQPHGCRADCDKLGLLPMLENNQQSKTQLLTHRTSQCIAGSS